MTFRHVRGHPTLECKVVIDGIAIVGKSWNFFETDKDISIRLPLLCGQVAARHYLKGFRFYGSLKHMYVIRLFELSNFKVDICFYNIEEEYLLFHNINKLVTNCLQHCTDEMPNSKTSNVLYQSRIPKLKDRIFKDGKTDLLIKVADFQR